MYEVLSPLGEETLKEVTASPRLPDLNGKTIGQIWNGMFHGDISFPIIQEMLEKQYPGVKVVPYTEFPIQYIHGSTEKLHERVDTIVRLAKEKGCDALIIGNGF